jgi:hypothetical protein
MPWWDDDDRLLDELRKALQTSESVPPLVAAQARGAFTWRTVDEELATLSHDSRHDELEPTGVRSAEVEPRTLTFEVDGSLLELGVSAGGVLGQVVPPAPGTVELRSPDGHTATAAMDDAGTFLLRPVPTGLVRLHVRADHLRLTTEWFRLTPDR